MINMFIGIAIVVAVLLLGFGIAVLVDYFDL